jgi:4'-phosphopantetheinyl transferase
MMSDMPHLWLHRVDSVLQRAPADSEWLSPSERERLPRLRVEPRRRQYLAGHWLLRELLAETIGGHPADWPLCERRSQAPSVDRGDAPLHVSLSHSGEWVAAAVAPQPIGIDIEPRHARCGMQRFDAMLRAADDAPGALDDDALVARWVLREALIKQHGGSALPEALAALSLRRAAADGPANLRLLTTDYVHLAIACDGASPRIHGHGDASSSRWCGSGTVVPVG